MFKVIVTTNLDAENQNNARFEISRVSFDFSRELTEAFSYCADHGVRLTVFARIDNQVARLFSEYHVYELAQNAYEASRRPEVQFAWHPHCFRQTGSSFEVIRGEDEIAEELRAIFERAAPLLGTFSAVRLGAVQSGNRVMQCINEMGFRFDSSALPGCRREDLHRHFDWSRTTNRPYVPSVADYQVSGYPEHSFLEVPITTIPTRASYDRAPKLRAINPVIHPEILRPALLQALPELQDLGFMVVLFHADELKTSYHDDLYTYGMENFRQNMDFIETTLLAGIQHEYVKVEEIGRLSVEGLDHSPQAG